MKVDAAGLPLQLAASQGGEKHQAIAATRDTELKTFLNRIQGNPPRQINAVLGLSTTHGKIQIQQTAIELQASTLQGYWLTCQISVVEP